MVVIEFMGMPRSGKTTVIKDITQRLDREGFSYSVIEDRDIESKISSSVNSAFDYNLEFHEILREEITHRGDDYSIIILDRGFTDGKAWIDVERRREKITDEQAGELERKIGALAIEHVDSVVLFKVGVETALARHKPSENSDSYTMNADFLSMLSDFYLDFIKRNSDGDKVLIVDGENPIEENIDVVWAYVRSHLT